MTPREDRPDLLDHDARTLLGPGPSDVHPRVIRAMASPVLGHLDPLFVPILDRLAEQTRAIFRVTKESHPVALVAPGPGMGGMECAMANLVEPGTRVAVARAGVFGGRLADVAARVGAEVIPIEGEWGQPLAPEAIATVLERERPEVLAIVHGETSTGVRQPMDEIARLARDHGALLVVDTVASMGGEEIDVGAWDADVVYTGSQKCLSGPPGLAPLVFSARALERVRARKTKPVSFLFDLELLLDYWEGSPRTYHHTAAAPLYYGLHEAMSIALEEGLEARYARHRAAHERLAAGLEELGLSLLPAPEHRLWVLNAVRVPEGVDADALRKELLARFGIEVGAGLGPFKGKIWRVGLMGESARENKVRLLLSALRELL